MRLLENKKGGNMESKEERQKRVQRTMERIQLILNEEQCDLEPFVLIASGQLMKKEINVVAKDLRNVNTPENLEQLPANPEGGK